MKLERKRSTYTGERAANYENERIGAKWIAENEAVAKLLSGVSAGETVLDIPVGTGRYAEIYASLGLSPIGIDISWDMMNKARERGIFDLREGSILNIEMHDGAVEYAVCTRLLNWMRLDEMRKAVAELARVAWRDVVLGIRLRDVEPCGPKRTLVIHHRRDFVAALADAGLAMVGSVQIDDAGYSIYRLTHVD